MLILLHVLKNGNVQSWRGHHCLTLDVLGTRVTGVFSDVPLSFLIHVYRIKNWRSNACNLVPWTVAIERRFGVVERVRHSVLGNGSLMLTTRYKRVARPGLCWLTESVRFILRLSLSRRSAGGASRSRSRVRYVAAEEVGVEGGGRSGALAVISTSGLDREVLSPFAQWV